jgi:hypothetical protein
MRYAKSQIVRLKVYAFRTGIHVFIPAATISEREKESTIPCNSWRQETLIYIDH